MILKAAYPYTRILKNQLQKELDSIIGESESAAVKNQNNSTNIFFLLLLK